MCRQRPLPFHGERRHSYFDESNPLVCSRFDVDHVERLWNSLAFLVQPVSNAAPLASHFAVFCSLPKTSLCTTINIEPVFSHPSTASFVWREAPLGVARLQVEKGAEKRKRFLFERKTRKGMGK
ncbi:MULTISPECIES: hypothetical protein [unclassified Geobacillus]|uniref:hypothetical protein n=1 Tax=unclassified Geobacillus TaxID=2642459 RepID=UPI0011AECF4E|nr:MULTISPECIES: hypothetical protein [unclassified Geobacillus]